MSQLTTRPTRNYFTLHISPASCLMQIETIEVASYDGNRYGDRKYARQSTRRSDQFSYEPNGYLVPVAHGCHGDDCPPEGVRYAVDLGILDVDLCVVDGAGEDEQADHESHEEEAEAFDACLEGEDEDLGNNIVIQ